MNCSSPLKHLWIFDAVMTVIARILLSLHAAAGKSHDAIFDQSTTVFVVRRSIKMKFNKNLNNACWETRHSPPH